VVLGDGAEWIWKRAAPFLGGRGRSVVEIVDIYHAYEHLWAVGHALCATPAAASAWVEPLKDALYARGAPAVLAALDALVPPDAAAADLLRTTHAYFADNAARMDYPRFVAQQLPIGSGAVESLCKTLIAARAKQAGMRWTPAGVQAIATLRALSLSGAWAAFWARHPLRGHLRLCPPARPRRRSATAPRPAVAPATPPALPPAVAQAPPGPAPALAVGPASGPLTAPPRRPAASHPWRRGYPGRARCA
jgi:hypothetical protein